MQNAKRVYETTFIVNASLDDTQINAVIDKVKELILKHSGEIRELVLWGRKRFHYTIQKKNNGFYVIIEFLAPGDLIAKLERHYFLDENIIRYLTIVLDKKALKARTSASLLVAEQNSESAAPAAAKVETPVPAAVNITTPSNTSNNAVA